ncbi:MAG: DUF937 domain-containing protein [Hyphomicrobium sp.]|nr:DUF937 domain-containing protein [Hyphomicrobium sp.]
MTIAPILKTAEAKAAIDGITRAYGLDAAQVAPVVDSLSEALTTRFTRMMLSRGGVADVVGLLGSQEAARTLDDPKSLTDPAVVDEGNHVLDVLIGNKHVSRGIAARTASRTGIDVEVAKKLLPVVASMMVGGLQKQAQPEINKLVRDMPALKAAGNRSPLPLPGDNIPGVGRRAPSNPNPNPFENLPDIIRRGGTEMPGGGSLEAIIRSVLGSLLGTQNRGVIGTLIQGLILRWLVNLVRRMFTR